ncbi:hypothetical protein [Lampropedia aestuarii]|uniref:hypothetical protein n=1 Tax=Lampropedia aestuarii TaxID=2562762 RepID=UPI00246948BD|nr:hypothetical protein [Lampropedia aestuarii]MDH5857474.1 hypothetical protein [Lampropedia aestuarii]
MPWIPQAPDSKTLRISRILQTTQLVTGLIFIPILFLLCRRLPVQAGWENGFFEILQNVVLGVGVLASLLMGVLRRQHVQRNFWLGISLVWLLMLGRELSWGAVFLAPAGFDPISGPYFSSQLLPYRPAIAAIGFGILAIALLLIALAKPLGLLRCAWQRIALLPWAYGLCMLISAAIGTAAEGKLGSFGHDWTNAQVVEEGFELLAYYFLLRAQIWSFTRWLKP